MGGGDKGPYALDGDGERIGEEPRLISVDSGLYIILLHRKNHYRIQVSCSRVFVHFRNLGVEINTIQPSLIFQPIYFQSFGFPLLRGVESLGGLEVVRNPTKKSARSILRD